MAVLFRLTSGKYAFGFSTVATNYRLMECEDLRGILADAKKQNSAVKILHAFSPENRSSCVREMGSFLQGRIPQARFVNLHDISNLSSPYHNTVPSSEQFSLYMQHADIAKTDQVIVYDESLTLSSRLHWLLNVFGHQNLYFLNGGFSRWKALEYPLERGFDGVMLQNRVPKRNSVNFEYKLDEKRVIGFEELNELNKRYNEQSEYQILDSRRPGQYVEGQQHDWTHIPVMDVVFAEDGRFKTPAQLAEIFEDNNVDFNKTIVQTCRRGLQATAADLAASIVCKENNIPYKARLYDSSWEEWMVKHAM